MVFGTRSLIDQLITSPGSDNNQLGLANNWLLDSKTLLGS